jgi:hypothetical protein
MPSISELAEAINRAAVGHPIEGLQDIRQRLRGVARKSTRAIFDRRTIFPTYAFHVGGRSEIQFNIGTETLGAGPEIRYGLSFSLEPSRSLPNVINVLTPKIARFNEYVRTYRSSLRHLWMWHFDSGSRSQDYTPVEIPPELVRPRVFVFLGLRQAAQSITPEPVLALFDRLLPLYEFTESTTATFPVLSRRTKFEFIAGCSTKPSRTTASLPERTLDLDLRHNQLQLELFTKLSGIYGADNVGTELNSGNGTRVDAVVRKGRSLWFYEIKTSLSARGCIREALPQLMEYSYWPGAKQAEKLIVVGEPSLDDESARYLATLRSRFKLPIHYEQLSIAWNT